MNIFLTACATVPNDNADPFVVKRNKDAFIQLINEHVDIVFSNHSELKILFNSNSLDSSVSELMNYTQSGGIKLGKRGKNNTSNNIIKKLRLKKKIKVNLNEDELYKVKIK